VSPEPPVDVHDCEVLAYTVDCSAGTVRFRLADPFYDPPKIVELVFEGVAALEVSETRIGQNVLFELDERSLEESVSQLPEVSARIETDDTRDLRVYGLVPSVGLGGWIVARRAGVVPSAR
jgi:hypothetical protein